MTLYSKWFDTHSEYEAYKNGLNYILPNVSICYRDLDVHYEKEFDPFNGYEYVDLGLPSGTLWAKCNIGATNESDYGLYFAWGETTGYTATSQHQFNWANYSYSDNNGSTMTKYNSTDNLSILELSDDAAHVNMGGDWVMPTKNDIIEIINNTTLNQTIVNNYLGILFTSKTNGNTIFFPYGGTIHSSTVEGLNEIGFVWASDDSERIYHNIGSTFLIDNSYVAYSFDYRCTGIPVRGIIRRN